MEFINASPNGQQIRIITHLTNKRSAIGSLTTGGHVEGGRGRRPLDGLRHKGHSRDAREGKEERGGDGKLHLGYLVDGMMGPAGGMIGVRGSDFGLLIVANDVLYLVFYRQLGVMILRTSGHRPSKPALPSLQVKCQSFNRIATTSLGPLFMC